MKFFSDLQENRSRIGSLFLFSRRGQGFAAAAATYFRCAAKVGKDALGEGGLPNVPLLQDL
ncbi:MAG: hypothetical protein LUE95_04125, partial [Oscillospiraceae bacterium]|nr:hypothetical protein [Oscillospiraceae bacterium]